MDDLVRYAIWGTAVGDAFGLKAEGLSRKTCEKIDNWERGIFFGRAIFSDDTEQSFLVLKSLLESGGRVGVFRLKLRRRLIGWFLALPPGVGLGTARSIVKLMFGFDRGVATAGNGAAMRTAVIGAMYYDDVGKVREFVNASTSLTHDDPRAFVGALVVALAAGAHRRGETWREVLSAVVMDVEAAPERDLWKATVEQFSIAIDGEESVREFASRIGCENGVTGYVYRTVPVALYAWATSSDPEATLRDVWRCGGDVDTVGAITGALVFCKHEQMPDEKWIGRIADFPLSPKVLSRAGGWLWWLMPVRNLAVFPWILAYAIWVRIGSLFNR